uniref:Uncharacterized protein n=2 Tax=Picea TaxID=3328 RepID=A0A124GPA2_PICGL|nr:hypothetical protein ABT39_MTgene1153 [Picea glauca]QHR91712.1 hypothetical protein Q903MT_gene5748 [Picea sitchensis]
MVDNFAVDLSPTVKSAMRPPIVRLRMSDSLKPPISRYFISWQRNHASVIYIME